MDRKTEERLDLPGGVTLAWGDAAAWKARFRHESVAAFQKLPPEIRLARALAMVLRHPNHEPDEPARAVASCRT